MRNHNRSFHACYQWIRKICDIPFYLSAFQGVNHILFIYKHISRKVQHNNIFLHQTNRIFIDHSFCAVHCRNMDCNIITFFVQLIYRLCVINISRQFPSCIYRDIRVIAIDIHTEMRRCIGNKHSDCSKSDYSKFFSFQLAPCKCLLLLFRMLRHIAVFLMLLHPVDSADDIS